MNIVSSLRSRFGQYKQLAEKAFTQLNDDQFLQPAPEGQNSIPVIIRHMHGNMISRFTNFLTEDGEKPWRQRDAEFEESGRSRSELMADWEAGWTCVFAALDGLTDAQLDATIHIRGEAISAFDALLRQLAHYSYHVGQIITLSKQQCSSWTSMSIPKGQSQQFNASMFDGKRPISGGAAG